MTSSKEPQKKELKLSDLRAEIIELSDLAQAINARCFYLREELKLITKKNN